VNPDWSAKAAAESGGSRISNQPTGVWLDTIAAITAPASREHADLLLSQARQHLGSAAAIAGSDPAGAYQLLYDAARKSLAAVLENQGIRATSRGGHIAVREASRRSSIRPSAGRYARSTASAVAATRSSTRPRRRRASARTRWSATFPRSNRSSTSPPGYWIK
jgi:hypothetical protein